MLCAVFVMKFWRSSGDIKVQETFKVIYLKIWEAIWSGIRKKGRIRISQAGLNRA